MRDRERGGADTERQRERETTTKKDKRRKKQTGRKADTEEDTQADRKKERQSPLITCPCVSTARMLAPRLRHAECMLRAALVTSARTWDRSRSVAVFISENWRLNATTARHRVRRRPCSALKYSLKVCEMGKHASEIPLMHHKPAKKFTYLFPHCFSG